MYTQTQKQEPIKVLYFADGRDLHIQPWWKMHYHHPPLFMQHLDSITKTKQSLNKKMKLFLEK